MRHLTILFILFLSLPLAAQAYTAQNRMSVADLGGGVFEVVQRGAAGPRDFWCAAGEYALSLGAADAARIYLVSGVQPSVSQPGRKAVRFTLSPQAAGITPVPPQLSLTVKVPGDNLRVISAREYCYQDISRF